MTAVPDLAAGRVRLRRLRLDDAPDLHQAFGDPAALRFRNSPPASQVAETASRIHRSLSAEPAEHCAFAVLAQDGGTARSLWMYGLLAPQWHAVTSSATQVPGSAP